MGSVSSLLSELSAKNAQRSRALWSPSIASEEESPAQATAEQPPHPELSSLQVIALLRMNRSTLCRGIAARMQSEIQDAPSLADYRELVARGFAQRGEGEKWHSITMLGGFEANRIAFERARKLGLHLLIDGPRERNRCQVLSCSCGHWSMVVRNGKIVSASSSHSFSEHVEHASGFNQAESA